MKRCLPARIAVLFFAVASIQAAASPLSRGVVPLVPTTDLPPWPETPFRGKDIAGNSYALSYRDDYDYARADVQLEFEPNQGLVYTGHLSAADLKPNFAYQMKLAGKPEAVWGDDGDDVTNERLGYAGRWWRVQPNPGNSTDAEYAAHKDDPGWIFEGYLIFGYFVTNRFGAADADFALNSSYHVLWWETQRTRQACDGPIVAATVVGEEEDEAYDIDTGPTDVGVYAEIERLCEGGTELPQGLYDCRFVLTEESFHQSGPADLGWVGVNGDTFRKDGGPFYYAGANCYYLMVYSAADSLRVYVDEVFADAKAMGLTVIRTWAFNDGASQWNALQTSPGVYDERVFRGLDYVLHKASESGIHLVLPFVNNWNDYGGMNQYVTWRGGGSHDQFYTDANCRQWYKDHIAAVLNRVNTYNGRTYKNDPTVLAWELANEPCATSGPSGDLLQGWIEEMASYVKGLDPQHLLTIGHIGYYGPSGPRANPKTWMDTQGVDFIRNHQPSEIDFACFHDIADGWNMTYQQSMDWTRNHIDDTDLLLGKPVVQEEMAKMRPIADRDARYQGWYDELYAQASAGDAAGGSSFWILYHNAYPDYDNYGVYYPTDASTAAIIASEAGKMRALSDPDACEGNWLSVLACDTLRFELASGEAPVFGPVSIENLTLAYTDDYAKNGDDLRLTAVVTHDPPLEASDITADFSQLLLGGGGAVPAETYDGTVAVWSAALQDVSLASDGKKRVTVTAVGGRGASSERDSILVDNTAPLPVRALRAEPHHERVSLSWQGAGALDVNYRGVLVRYDAVGDYPEYEAAESYPDVPSAGKEALDVTGAVTGGDHAVAERDVYYYTAFAYDWAGNYGPAADTAEDRSTNYWLGDMHDPYNGLVDFDDISDLSGTYWLSSGNAEFIAECDIAPTDDHTAAGVPEPDGVVDFEDLMVVSLNYDLVGPTTKREPIVLASAAAPLPLALRLEREPAGEPATEEAAYRVVVEGNRDGIRGASLLIAYDPEVLAFASASRGAGLDAGVFFRAGPGSAGEVRLDLALLGAGRVIRGDGDLAIIHFRVKETGPGAVRLREADLRDAGNKSLVVDALHPASEAVGPVPAETRIVGAWPNPFNPVTSIRYELHTAERVLLHVYDPEGRAVRTLEDGSKAAGRHSAIWDGRDDRGREAASGIYFVRMAAGTNRETVKIVLLR